MKVHRELFARIHRLIGKPAVHDAQLLDPRLADLDVALPESDPLPLLESLRHFGAVVHLPVQHFWVVLGYEEARQILQDSQHFSSNPYRSIDMALLSTDQPRHTQVRQLLAPMFSAQVLDGLVAAAQTQAARLLKPSMEIVTEYAQPLSRRMGAQLIGLNPQDSEFLIEATRVSYEADEPYAVQFAAVDRVAPRSQAYQYLQERGSPVLSGTEISSLLRLFWVASTVTMERMIAAVVYRLLHEPVAREAVQNDASLLTNFIDEVARLHPPEQMLRREAVGHVKIGDVTIPAGAAVRVSVRAANRDPLRLRAPHDFDLYRKSNRHLSFGAGIHHCIGAALAQRQLPVVVGTLLHGMPGFRATEPLLPLTTQFVRRLQISQ